MAIRGSLKEASLPDVIQLLHLGRRTGCLALSDRQNFGYIWFDQGRIVFAQIVNRRDRLGDLLLRAGRITTEQLERAITLQQGDRAHRLGDILLMMGALTREQLEAQVRVQIEEAVYYLFTWTTGTFNFEAGVTPEDQDLLVSINPEYLLLEGARRVDEWSVIEKKVPSFDVIFTADQLHAAASGAALSEPQQRLLPLLDGTRDVQQLVDETGLVEFEVGKALYGLVAAGFAQRTGSSLQTATHVVQEGRVEEHRNLGVAFYKTAMYDEAAREFRRVAELRPAEGSAPFFLGLIAARQGKWAEAAEAFRLACDKGGPRAPALHNLGYALEQLGRLDESELAYAEAVSRSADDARLLVAWGVIALKRGELGAAAARLARAREVLGERKPSPVWFWAASLTEAMGGDLDRARELAREGTEAHPQRAALRNTLAVLLELGGDAAGAEAELRAGLAADASLAPLSKNLGDLLYRAARYPEALSEYERARQLAPALGDDLHFKIGNIHFRQGDAEGARAAWEQALALNDGHALARANLAMLDAPPA